MKTAASEGSGWQYLRELAANARDSVRMQPMSQMQNVGGALGRMLGRRVAKDRMLSAGISAARVTLRTFGRVLHVLFLEVAGLIFFCIALVGLTELRRQYVAYAAGKIGPGKVIAATVFLLVFLWFGISSFWKARRRRA